jgi:hypothetical protein
MSDTESFDPPTKPDISPQKKPPKISDKQKNRIYIILSILFIAGVVLIGLSYGLQNNLEVPVQTALLAVGSLFLASAVVIGIPLAYKKKEFRKLKDKLKDRFKRKKRTAANFPVFQSRYDCLHPSHKTSSPFSPYPTVSTFCSQATHTAHPFNASSAWTSTNSNYQPFTHYQKYGYYHPIALQISQYSNSV